MLDGKVIKLMIVAYKDPEFSTPVNGIELLSMYMLQTNPTTYSFAYSTVSKEPVQLANTTQASKSEVPDKKKLNLSFTVDSTGAILPFPPVLPVDIEWLSTLCLNINGDIHTSNYLVIFWGMMVFKCKTRTLKIEYTMFNPAGIPVRAKVDAEFEEFITPASKAIMANLSSPDMSHLVTVKAGDQLPELCNRIYGDSKFYLQVAELNRIINFRKLIPGQRILFPRMEK
jgi:hypothetical protein